MNSFVTFLKNIINLAIVLAVIIGGGYVYEKLFPFMIKHIILYSFLFLIILSVMINIIDNITKSILARTYVDTEELKQLTKYVVDEIRKDEKEEIVNTDNIIPLE